MGIGWIDELDEVLVACRSALHTNTATSLCAELGEGSAFDVAEVTHGHDHLFLRIELFWVEVFAGGHVNLGFTLVAPFLLHFEELVLHHLLTEFWVIQNLLEIFNQLHQFVILSMQFLLL